MTQINFLAGPGAGAGISVIATLFGPDLEAAQPRIQRVWRVLSLGLEKLERVADHSCVLF